MNQEFYLTAIKKAPRPKSESHRSQSRNLHSLLTKSTLRKHIDTLRLQELKVSPPHESSTVTLKEQLETLRSDLAETTPKAFPGQGCKLANSGNEERYYRESREEVNNIEKRHMERMGLEEELALRVGCMERRKGVSVWKVIEENRLLKQQLDEATLEGRLYRSVNLPLIC